jgi:hypothetical protein
MTAGIGVGAKELIEAARKFTAAFQPNSTGEMEFAPVVLSCVVYKSVSGRTFYRSAYANEIMMPICDAALHCNGGPVPFRPGLINTDQLMFAPSFDAEARVE